MVEPYFDPHTVVSQDPHGQPLSLYADRSWSISALGTDGGETSCNIYFFEAQPLPLPHEISRPDLAALVREQQKALLWLHMDAGRQRAQPTTSSASNTLTQLARGAYRRGVALFELFCDPDMLGEESTGLNSNYAKHAKALLKTMWRHRDFLKIRVEVRLERLREAIKQSAPQKGDEGNQTPIIPSRIYCSILAGLLGSLDGIERDLDILLAAYRQERAATIGAPEGLIRSEFHRRRSKQLKELRQAMRARGWTKGSLQTFIAGKINRVQLRLLNLVIAFTGMRIGEALILPLRGVLDEVEHRGSVHHVVNGYSQKLNGGRKKSASWVTSREGHRAIVLARRIASTILEVLRNGDPASDNAALLFCSMEKPYKKATSQRLYQRMARDLVPEICPLITQADIDELNAMELERGWQREGIEVGKPWPLTFHQYRRSLSVYAHRSGMVSLPALKGQLQHITDEMRAYYADGFCRAVNLVLDRNHFSHEWKAAKAESSFLGYTLGILFSDDELLGRGAERMADAVAGRTRLETLQLFRDGKLAYKENVLGGCVSTEPCKVQPLEVIELECLERNCVNQVVSPRRLDHVIRSQEIVVATLGRDEHGSVEHRLEVGSLQVLLKARQRIAETA
jgi:integrase